MARTRSPKYEGIQLGILKKAARLFATHGYERTSIGDLVRACDLSRGAIYHYFESKEAILFAMMDSLVRGLLESLTEAAAQEGEPLERLQRIIVAFVESNARSPDEQTILLNDLGALSRAEQKQIHAIEKQVVDLVADAIAAADTRGLVTPRTRKVYTMMLFGMINYTYTWYDAKGPVKPRELADMATDLFFNGFLQEKRGAGPALRLAKR
ncbi:MAG TPA: TetR/AcrR family transcriptional regulator [Rhodoblastus sp.]|nr:TetR/AcrR family transcriptional regulator [Rhodoblastus sp.]